MNKITYLGTSYDDQLIRSVDGYIGDALASEKLAVDTIDAVVIDKSLQPMLLIADVFPAVADGNLAVAQKESIGLDARSRYGDAVRYYRDNTLFGKFYLAEKIKRTGKYEYSMSCVSAIGLLLTEYHYGGIYNGETAAEVIADVVGGTIYYSIDTSLAAVPIYGRLKKATRRDNLRDVLFAIGAQIRKNAIGELNIIPMTAGETYEITSDEFYTGGSVTGGNPATGVKVTEHSFIKLPDDETVALYEGETVAEELATPKGKRVTGVLVDFAEPMHDLTIENAEILESGANYAVLSSSANAVLKGQKYTHTQRVISRSSNTGGPPNVPVSSECCLVNQLNAELVADRLMAYYGYGKTVEADIVVDNQRPGDAVTFTDPFGSATTGFIADMDLTMSAILKARVNIVSGFVPTASGNYYNNVMVITESSSVTIPAECKGKVRVVLIGGGDGGEAGESGEDGDSGTTYASVTAAGTGGVFAGDPGNGGKGGKGGAGGKILVATMSVKAGQTLSAVIGQGGAGAIFGGLPGSGTATKLGNLTSDDGASANGYVPINGDTTYAMPGRNGEPGGRGQEAGSGLAAGDRPAVTYDGDIWTAGSEGTYAIAQVTTPELTAAMGVGGRGGGAAVGADGTTGANGIAVENGGTGEAVGGDGANGATPIAADDGVIPGQGGQGGHGGGGGGGGGTAIAVSALAGKGGTGGKGGAGGNGADGIILIYY